MTGSNQRCLLPSGYIDAEGRLHREAELVALAGSEEELLAAPDRGSAELVSELITRCVKRIGGVSPVDRQVARALLTCDRAYLLLMLRRVTFGDRVVATLACPGQGCGQRIDIDFSISDLPLPAAPECRSVYQTDLELDDAGEQLARVEFRLPNGADQEELGPLLARNPAVALSALLARCITHWDGRAGLSCEEVAALPAAVRARLEAELEARAPELDLSMEGSCPHCERSFLLPLDVQDLFFGELRITGDMLCREVHYLAYHYHWSEREILAMPRARRRKYIDILAAEIERIHESLS